MHLLFVYTLSFLNKLTETLLIHKYLLGIDINVKILNIVLN